MKFNRRRIKVLVELTSKCNLRCGMCPLPVLRRPYEDMEWSLVEKAEREIHGLGFKLKWLHEMGEPLLYSRIDDAIRLFPEASISTNGLVLTEEVGAKLLGSPLKRLRISVDSINPKVYPQLRTGGDFDKLVDMTKKFLEQAKGHPIRIEIQKIRQGRFGYRVRAFVPQITGGSGSVLFATTATSNARGERRNRSRAPSGSPPESRASPR